MESNTSETPQRAAMKAALDELRQRRAEIDALRRERSEPIAVIGMACRFPGGSDTPEDFWKLLDEGRDAIAEVPRDRWNIDTFYDPDPSAVGKMATRSGGFLRRIDEFDSHFFGISPREARSLDPQQHLLLEVAWEALENAYLPPEQLYRSQTGVFVGITCFDHAIRLSRSLDISNSYAGTGSALNMAPGRLSYLLGLTGPSMAIDTACSSSLVALHLACQSLRARESDLALVGGVLLMMSAEVMVSFSQARMLAGDGRCKTFDERADGYARGEGCGVVVLKRLSDAVADGDVVLGMIRGSAVNQDGPSGGLTVPSANAQQRVIQSALKQGGVKPGQIQYVEAHGTGTALGDPIEIEALAQVYGDGRDLAEPLIIGAVKTNIGHLEPASGMAGLIKILLSFRHGRIPPHLHFQRPNPHIAWAELPIQVAAEGRAWPPCEKRRAGLSAFGFSGTNAHVIVEAATATTATAPPSSRSHQLLTLSAKSDKALTALTNRYVDFLSTPLEDVGWASICRAAGAGRNHFSARLAVVATSAQEAKAALQNSDAKKVGSRGKATPGQPPKVAFLFTGQGSQYAGMADELYRTEPTFRKLMERCAAVVEIPLLRAIFPQPGDAHLIDQTAYTQPALFAVEYALAELWKSWGVRPSVVLGHSVGEYVAACQAGVMMFEDALRLLTTRAGLMGALPQDGAMVAVFADSERMDAEIEEFRAEVSVAAINGPAHTVISGRREAVAQITERMRAGGIRCRELRVSHAFHSPLMKPVLEEFRKAAQQVRFSKPLCKIISNVSGELTGDEMTDPEYWVRHVMSPVNFAGGMTTLQREDAELFLEIGPNPVLSALGRECTGLPAENWLASLRSRESNWKTLLESLGAFYVKGGEVEWPAIYRGVSLPQVAVPNYPFQRRRYELAQVRDASPVAPDESESVIDEWLYRVEWERHDRRETNVLGEDGRWLILADRGGIGRAFAAQVKGDCEVVTADVLRHENTDGLKRLLLEAHAGQVVFFQGLDAPRAGALTAAGLEEFEQACCGSLLRLVQAAASLEKPVHRIWVVTRGAVEAGPAPEIEGLAQSPLWGVGKVASLEHPEIFGGCIDLDPARPNGETAMLLREILAAGREDQVAFRDGLRYVPRLTKAIIASPGRVCADGEGAYLITGGFGALGLKVAGWLAAQGARRLVLVGRRGRNADGVAMLEASGVEVRTVYADVGDGEKMAMLFEGLRRDGVRLRGIVHAAGLPGYQTINHLTVSELSDVMRPKVRGAWILHELSRHLSLDFFICFSSIASVWGSRAQAHYSAANRFLDMLAHYRRAHGLPGLSVNWGPWEGGGMNSAEADALLRRVGVRTLSEAGAFDALAQLIGADFTQVAVADVDWPQFKGSYEARGERPLLERFSLTKPPEPGAQDQPTKESPLVARLGEVAAAAQREALLLSFVRSEAALVLALAPALPEPEQGFFEMGMDSLLAMEFRARLEVELGCSLPATLVFDYPTAQALAAHLAERFGGAPPDEMMRVELSRPSGQVSLDEQRAGDDALVNDIEQLSDEEAEELLLKRLEALV